MAAGSFCPARPRRLARPRTPPFHGDNTGSNPVGDAKDSITYDNLKWYFDLGHDGVTIVVPIQRRHRTLSPWHCSSFRINQNPLARYRDCSIADSSSPSAKDLRDCAFSFL